MVTRNGGEGQMRGGRLCFVPAALPNPPTPFPNADTASCAGARSSLQGRGSLQEEGLWVEDNFGSRRKLDVVCRSHKVCGRRLFGPR